MCVCVCVCVCVHKTGIASATRAEPSIAMTTSWNQGRRIIVTNPTPPWSNLRYHQALLILHHHAGLPDPCKRRFCHFLEPLQILPFFS